VSFVAAGFRQSYIILQNSLRGCGESKKYELGKSSKKTALWHALCEQLSMIEGKITRTVCGKRFLAMLTDRHEVYAFGCNEENCFNNKEITHLATPTLIFKGVSQLACGWAHIVLLKLDQTVESYGRTNLGQLGHGQ
jgi:alpha-tubulin suppressor-like RCC1 family protein